MAETRKVHPNGDTYCSVCKNERSIEDQKRHPERMRKYQRTSHLRRRYGLESDITEGRACDICGTIAFGKRRAHIDHDHEAGSIRGVLCHRCNTGIGLLGNNLIKAIEYLDSHNAPLT